MTDPTPTAAPADLDLAALAAMRDLAIARQASPPDPDAIRAARQALLDARAARGY